ncbi:hypothetical protein MCC93_24920 [Morococcus cerebrosus]|uniref:Uncharacterized protein n=1 Tax=Morococcus cerebrosus TaxID=1056807 RepID=A0A0C1GKT7_9NEIS|nr:hypothetical protein MCC93_24920 [Morococcus cerebrosus]
MNTDLPHKGRLKPQTYFQTTFFINKPHQTPHHRHSCAVGNPLKILKN